MITTIHVSSPDGIAVNGTHAYLATEQGGGSVVVIDTATNTLLPNSISIGADSYNSRVAMSPDGTSPMSPATTAQWR